MPDLLVRSFAPLLLAFQSCFTQPSFHSFWALSCAWILSVSLGNRQVRQIPIPNQLKKEVEESLRAFAQMQKVLKQIAQVNLELFKERKRQRP